MYENQNASGSSLLRARVQPDFERSVKAYCEREKRSVSNTIRFALYRLLEEDRKQRISV